MFGITDHYNPIAAENRLAVRAEGCLAATVENPIRAGTFFRWPLDSDGH
jgi:hypothetical protein